MHKNTWTWVSTRLGFAARVARWGHFGAPVLIYPSAGGDFEEIERCHLIAALAGPIEAGAIKVFSIDGIAARSWLAGATSREHCEVLNRCDAYLCEEVMPLIRQDCQTQQLELIVGGAALGAFSALTSIIRHPDLFRVAVCLSGNYERSSCPRQERTETAAASGLHDLVSLDAGALEQLRRRFIVLATGNGDFEDPAASSRVAEGLAGKLVPNCVDLWGRDHHHQWRAWCEMLPKYLAQHV